MIPATFGYARPATLDEAIGLLGGDDVKILAGGQSLLPLLKLRLTGAAHLVDIGRIDGLRGVGPLRDGGFSIGSLTTYRELMDSPVMAYTVLAEALPTIGDVQVRNRGTVGGAIAHGDPALDLPAVLLALDATIVARSSRGERMIPAAAFFVGYFQTALEPDEILTQVRLPPPGRGHGSTYLSLEQPASGYSIVGVAAVAGRLGGGSGSIDDVRVAITGVGEKVYRAAAVEAAILAGSDPADAAAHATDGQEVASDIHAAADYRAEMARVYTRRALEAAIARAG